MYYGNAGTIIMDGFSLLLMGGMLFYTSLYRKRGRLDDRLFCNMIVVNMIYAGVELVTYAQEGAPISFLRTLMIVENTVVYAALVLFPYLFMLYTDFRCFRDEQRYKRVSVLYGIPCMAWFAILVINLWTGWIFTINESCQFIDGQIDQIVFIPIVFYIFCALLRVRRIDIRLVFLGILLAAVRMLWDVWYMPIESTSFMYALYLVLAHIHVMNQPLAEERL